MAQCVDFLHPRLHNSVVLQSIQYVANAVSTALYDGVSDDDLNIVILELCKLCVPHFVVGEHQTYLIRGGMFFFVWLFWLLCFGRVTCVAFPCHNYNTQIAIGVPFVNETESQCDL